MYEAFILENRPDVAEALQDLGFVEAPLIEWGAGSAGSPEPSEAAIEAAHRRLMASTAQDEDDAREDVRWILRAAYKVQFGAASPSSPERINGEVEALRDVVRAVDVELYGKDTAANVHSDEYAAKLFKRGVRASGEGREPAVPTDGD